MGSGFEPDDRLATAVRAIDASLSRIDSLNGQLEALKRRDVLDQLDDFLRTNYPGRYFVPNLGQENAILPLKTIDVNDDEIRIGVFAGGNGVGKTTTLVNFARGLAWGRTEMSSFYSDWKVFEKFENIRKDERRPIRIRFVCHAVGMEESGQVYQEIMKWWPKGLYQWEKNHKSYYSMCKCYDHEKNLVAIINVRTFDQDKTAHAGPTEDAILVDEPMPQELFSENIGRLRTKKGGILWMFLTPLEVGGWIKDQLADRDDVTFTSASIWDNCRDWHPTKALRGKTRGHLARSVIDRMIKEWKKEGPEIAEAREKGTFTHLSGSVFKEFNAGVHVIEPFEVPRDWPVYCVMDPHDGKPSMIGWYAVAPDETIYWIAEYPDQYWTKAGGGGSVKKACEAIREIEAPFRGQVIYRFGDPMKLKMPYSNSSLTLQGEYAAQGYRFGLADNAVDIGLSRVRGLLEYDQTQAISPSNRPKMYFFSRNWWFPDRSNQNLVTGMAQLCYKKDAFNKSSERAMGSLLRDDWKDPVDVVRYGVMSKKPFAAVSAIKSFAMTLKSRVMIRRNPV